MNKIIYIFIFLPIFLFSQNKIQGIVLDSRTKEPLAFANITFNDNPVLNVTTDIDGKFNFKSNVEFKKLVCTYVGFEKFETNGLINSNEIKIMLFPISNRLNEVVINKNNNPANRIIKKVIENKELNNPENISAFQYKSYNKSVFDVIYNKSKKKDSLQFRKIVKDGHILIMENVTERKFIKPDLSEEVIIASKVSGFKNPTFATIATDFQPFSFYQNNIKLLDIYYLNPISSGSLKKYKYRLEETLVKEKDTVFIISFKPIINKNFEGLSGLLYINSNKYAIQNVIAFPAEKGKLNLKIQQQYQLIENQYWFPEKLNYELVFGQDAKSKNIGISVNGKCYINEVKLNIPLKKQDISPINLRMLEEATHKDSLFWNKNRFETLNGNDLTTYKVIDSLGKKMNFDRFLIIMEKIAQNKFPTKYFDVDLKKTLVFNQFEGFRIGTGLFTNEKLSDKLTIGSFCGFGTRDREWKYGVSAKYLFSKEKDFFIMGEHKKELIETGSLGLNTGQDLLNFRKIISFSFNKIIENSVNLNFKNFTYATWNISISNSKITPLFFDSSIKSDQLYNKSEISILFRYAYKEKIINSLNSNVSLGTKFPILYLSFSKALKNIFNSNLDFETVQASLLQTFYTKNIGLTTYFLELGQITKRVPSRFLFTGEGSNFGNNFFNFYSSNNFQTMYPYEFLSDKYANLFLTHDFGSLLFKAKNFKPSFVFHNNIGWGALSNNNNFVNAKTMDKVYLETGLQLNSLVKIKMDNLGYLGLGIGGFLRYGYYSYSDFKQNSVFKINLKYTIN